MQSEVQMTGWKTLLHAEGAARRIPLLSLRVEVVHRLDATHFEVLRPPHLDQLVGLIHQWHAE
jgi:hypothetical protein